MNENVLNSWKEIASYLGRGVRTVQRWERELNLPVRRPRGKERSAVLALKSELDQWLRVGHRPAPEQRLEKSRLDHLRLQKSVNELVARANELVTRSKILRDQIALAMNLGHGLVQNRKQSVQAMHKFINWGQGRGQLGAMGPAREAPQSRELKAQTPLERTASV